MRNVIVNKTENCVGCNRCVRVCPLNEANIVTRNHGQITVQVDNSKCIACGACLVACHHGARAYEDDTERFFSDLRQGVPISMFAAPAAKTNFNDWERMLTWLRQIGVRRIYDVSLGADICTWAHIRYLQKHGLRPIISQPCPAIVNYILLHRNELLKYLSPVHSPMLCTAVFMRKYERVSTKIAALSPCIAKTYEFEATHVVDYNVTIDSLLKYIEEHHVVFPPETSGFDHYDAGLGSLFPMPGGLKENVEYYLGKSIRIDKSEGQGMVYKALDEYAEKPASKLPVLFDVLNCPEGCNLGTGCRAERDMFDINSRMDELRQSAIREDRRQYLDELYDRFDKTLRVEDFIRKYVPIPVRSIWIEENNIDEAFLSLGKTSEASRNFDCGACGCDSCLEMAQKIAKGVNTPMNCIEKTRQDILRENEASKADLSSFAGILDDTAHIKQMTEDIVSRIDEITEAVTAYNRMISDTEKIAMQINIISLNASIEAARAGMHGKAFGVVAEEIRRLAATSDISAKQTKEASVKATAAIGAMNEMVSNISESINASYENIFTIAEKTKMTLLDFQNISAP